MSLKPVNTRSPLATREAIWKAIRSRKIFTVRDLRDATQCSMDAVREYVFALANAGFVTIHAESSGIGSPNVYALAKDNGVEPPRVRRDGTEVTQGRAQENMWRTMRLLKNFTVKDLAIQAATEEIPVAVIAAKSYCGHLLKAGYLQIVTPAKVGIPARYYFPVRAWTGPKPPMIQRTKQIYDPNTRKVVWSSVEVTDDAS